MYCWSKVLMLGLPLLCIFGIVWLFLHYSKNFKAEPRPRTNILYISGYAILIIIGLIVFICLNNYQSKDIISTISFGATLSSLILSVVAIIFTIVSGKNGEVQLGKITRATDELQNTAKYLEEFKTIANALTLTIADKFEDVDAKLRENIEQAKATHSETKAIHADLLNSRNSEMKNSEKAEGNESKADIQSYIKGGSYLGAIAMIACVYSNQKDIVWKTKEMGGAFSDLNLQYINGYIISSTAFGIIDFKGQFPDITVSKCAEGLEAAALEKIKDFIASTENAEFKDELTAEFHELQAYFAVTPTPVEEAE